MEAITLFKESLDWLRNNYGKYQFFIERDIVWTMQMHLRDKVADLKLSYRYRVVTDWPMIKGKKRYLCADLVILENDQPRVAVEFKYEPNHNRKQDFSENKLKNPIVFWSGKSSVEDDIKRIRQFAMLKEIFDNLVGVSIFIDEGGKFYKKQKMFPGSIWELWDNGVAVLIAWSNDDH